MKYEVDGKIYIVDGDKIQIGSQGPKKQNIGPNFVNGINIGGTLSCFSGTFDDELIAVDSALGDPIFTKIGDIKYAYEILKSKIVNVDANDIFELSRVVLETIDEYFNGFDNIKNRLNYYYIDDMQESENNKISNLMGTGAAMCVERAAVAQNLLKALGIESYYKASGIIYNNKEGIHAYNLIKFKDKYYIFDSAMPNLINGKVNPLIAEIDKETFDLISAPIFRIGISTTVSHYNPYRNMDITVTYDSGRKNQIEVDSLGDNEIKRM